MVKNHARVRELIEQYPECPAGRFRPSSCVQGRDRGQDHLCFRSGRRDLSLCVQVLFGHAGRASLRNVDLDDKAMVNRAKELLESDPYAKMYDPAEPQKFGLQQWA